MSTYRYVTTNILTGAILADTLPIHVQSMTRAMGGVGQPGTLTGAIDLGVISGGSQSAYLGAMEPRRSMLWALQDAWPIWAGVLWDWPHSSIASNQLPIQAAEVGSLFAKRQVRANQQFGTLAAPVDLFTIVRGLLSYTLAKTNGGVAGLNLGSVTQLSGTTTAITFAAQNLPQILSSLTQFASQYAFEFDFAPGLDASGNLAITLQLGMPTVTRPVASTNLQFLYPGPVSDYAFPRTGSSSVNSLIATASSSGSIPWQSGATHGQNALDFSAGYPLLEGSVSYTAAPLTLQSQIDGYADGQLAKVMGTATVPTVTVAAGQHPFAKEVAIGDEAWMVATSPLHPANPDGSPGLQTKTRIIGWTLTPPDDQQAETTVYALGGDHDVTTSLPPLEQRMYADVSALFARVAVLEQQANISTGVQQVGNTQILASPSPFVDFPAIPSGAGYTWLQLLWRARLSTSASADVLMQIDGVSTSTYSWGKVSDRSGTASATSGGALTTAIKIGVASGLTAGYFGSGVQTLAGWSSATGFLTTSGTNANFDTASTEWSEAYAGEFAAAGPHNSIRIFAGSSLSFDAGSAFSLFALA